MSNPSDARAQLQLLAKAEVLAKVAREQLGVPLDARAVAMLAQGGQFGEKPGVYNRLKGAVSYLVSGVTGQTWMGPFQPLPAMQDQPEKGTIGRAFDYPVGLNTTIQPRQGEITFSTLRNLAESYDLMRLAVETCKDQIESFEWDVVPEDDAVDPDTLKAEVKRVSDFLEYPDREHNWNQWLRMFVEDMLVLDGVCVFPQQTRGGSLYSFDLIDPSTIKRVIDEYGRTPMAPDPAYQQVLKGIPAVDYTRDQLVYVIRNPRTWKLYGYGPVEQVIMTVSIAMRRQLSQLQFYTEGNVPEALVSAPDAWTPEQVADFQLWFDSMLAGNTGARRRMHFVPNLKDGKVVFTKPGDNLKDDYDEWLAKIICYAFSIPPSALIKQLNRASSEQMAESAKEEGQMPRMRFIASQINFLLKTRLATKGVVFKWRTEVVVDPLKKASATKIYLDGHVITPDEARQDDLGKSALTPEEREAAWPTPLPPAFTNPDGTPITGDEAAAKQAGQGGAGGPTGPGAKKPAAAKPDAQAGKPGATAGGAANGLGKTLQGTLLRKKTLVPVLTAAGRAVATRERSVTRAISKVLSTEGQRVASAAVEAYAAAGFPRAEKLAKVSDDEAFVLRVLADLGLGEVSVGVLQQLTADVTRMFQRAGVSAVAQVGANATRDIVNQLDAKAKDYAEARGAELVTGLTATTRDRLREQIMQAVTEGWSTDTLRRTIEDGSAFGEARASTIARTELAKAHVEGNVEGWRQTGEVEGKRSILGDLHDFVDECDDCAEAGTVDLEDDFVDGYDFPPYHPNCICDVLPVLRSAE